MKRILVILSVLFLTSCATDKYIMSQEEIEKNGYTLEGWSIMRGGEIIGNVTSVEWELYDGKMVKEISLTLKDYSKAGEVEDVIKYVYTQFPKSKIEMNMDGIINFDK